MLQIKEANIDDAALILDYIKKKAIFDAEMSGEHRDISTTIDKIKNTLFGDSHFAKVLFARNANNDVLGFALYHHRYSSFLGKPSIWLDDLYVDSNIRSSGIGMELMLALKEKGININASHISWNANHKNTRGKKFYNRFGAELVDEESSPLLYRYTIQS